MDRPGSTALIYAVFVFFISSTRHFKGEADATASTTFNLTPINDSVLLKPQELYINTTTTIIPEQPINSPIQSHHSHHCHNKTCHKNESILSNYKENSTFSKPLLPQTPQKSNQLQHETEQFINAEKMVPHEESIIKIIKGKEETKNNTVIVQSNNGTNIIREAQKIIQPKNALDSPKIISNQGESVKRISNVTDENDEDRKYSWIKSPFLQNILKYLTTDFYPEKILNSLSNRLSFSNRTKAGGTIDPSVVYPVVMEGVSVLLNRLTENESRENTTADVQGAIRGRIANIMIESIKKVLHKFQTNEISPVEDDNSNLTSPNEKADGIDGLMNLDTMKRLLPLVQTVQSNGEFSDIMSKFLSNPPGELGDLDLSSLLKNYGPQFNGLLSNKRILNAIAKQSSSRSDSLNLTSIMEQFMPKNGGEVEDGMSPKNPLLRSEFVSKVLSKSPVAHLGALDDNIKKLVASSLERAVSRVKINQNGQIQMSEGMKKMVSKMLHDGDSKSTGTSAMDSINGLLKSVAQISSGPMNVTEDPPKSRRNVTKHSHLHRRFEEKYGRDPRVRGSSSSILQASFSPFIVILIPLIVW